MKIKKQSILLLIIIITILLDIKLFYIAGINTVIVLPVIILGFIATLFLCRKEMAVIRHDMKMLRFVVYSSVISYILLFIYTLITFKSQNWRQTIYGGASAYGYAFVLFVFIVLCWLMYRGSAFPLMKLLNGISFIWYIVLTIQLIFYFRNGTLFLNGYNLYNYFGALRTRGNVLRLGLEWFGNYMVLYNFHTFYSVSSNKKDKKWNLFMFIYGILLVLLVQRTRMATLCIGLCILIIVLLDQNYSISLLRKLLVIASIIVVLVSSDIISRFISSFDSAGIYAASTNVRLYAISYYWSYFMEHPIFGFACVSPDVYGSVIFGPLGRAYTSDVGIIAQFAKAGIMTLFLYIIPMARIGYIIHRIKVNANSFDYVFLLVTYIYLIITSATLIVLDRGRIIMWPIVLALFEYCYWRINQNNYSKEKLL